MGRASRLPAYGAGCGQLFVARRDAYQACGGHSAIRETLHDGPKLPRAFRAAARVYLAQKDRFVIVNYLRKALGQEIGGHISPLAAYDSEADRFLILDVARYKYPPVWVKASDLFDAMNTSGDWRTGLTRGLARFVRSV